jgi:membrane-associated phospholipid phosphatase
MDGLMAARQSDHLDKLIYEMTVPLGDQGGLELLTDTEVDASGGDLPVPLFVDPSSPFHRKKQAQSVRYADPGLLDGAHDGSTAETLEKTVGNMINGRMVAITGSIMLIFAVVDALWLSHSNVSLDTGNFVELAKVAGLLLMVYCLGKVVIFRLEYDATLIGRSIARAAECLLILVRSAALLISLGILGAVFMYVASSTQAELMDASLADIDAALGFDWLVFLSWANSSTWLSMVLVIAYHSVGPQIPMVLVILAMALREDLLLQFIALMSISSLLAAIGLALVPAAGAYAFFAPPAETYANFTRDAGMWHYTELMKLRSGEPFLYQMEKAKGLVTFPSYHTALGIIITYALREIRWIFVPVAILNSVMLVSTVPEGGHHLIDVLAGLAIGLISIAIVRAARRGIATHS